MSDTTGIGLVWIFIVFLTLVVQAIGMFLDKKSWHYVVFSFAITFLFLAMATTALAWAISV